MLHSTTILINFVFLIAAVWLGIYVITRSPRNLIAWLTGLTLWSVAGLFLNMLLALNPPPLPANLPDWVALLIPFWPVETLDKGWSGWLQGWLVVPSIVIWHHVTVLLRPGPMNLWRWTRVSLGYAVAVTAILIHIYTPLLFSSVSGDPLLLNTLKPGPLYPLFLVLLILFIILSLINLMRSARETSSIIQTNQLNIMAAATIFAGLTGPVALIAATTSITIPRVTLSFFLGIAVILLGYGVSRYSALMEGRTIRRDFIYNAISMGLITGLYLLVTWISSQIFNVPAAVFIFLVLLAIVTHSLIDVARQTLDFLFFNRERREMRLNLNKIASSVAEQELEESLILMLDTMCVSVRATYGLIIIFEELRLTNLASYQWRRSPLPVSRGDLVADDVQHVDPGKYPSPLEEAALLIPLYTNSDQFGAILLGRPVNGIKYSPSDIELLLYPSDQVVDVIQDSWREGEFLSKITQFAETQQPAIDVPEGIVSVKIVEDALRNLFDYAHLGDTQLVKLKIVHQRLPSEAITHIDQGKAVNAILSEVIEKLRPSDQFPREPIPREWFPYYILHGAYLEDKLNRDIMSLLYISEGTFNRTRRAAIRSVTRMLEEMEAASS